MPRKSRPHGGDRRGRFAPAHEPRDDDAVTRTDSGRLRLLTYNIQVGLRTQHYGHYVTRAWRHALPGIGPHTLAETARLIRDHDFVAIQEADAGSLRTRFVNQMEVLAQEGDFAWHGLAVTRDLHPVARHCLGFLSRWPTEIAGDHALPGPVPGRRVLQVAVRIHDRELSVFVVHLSLGREARHRQIAHVASLTRPDRPSVILGDFNCEPQVLAGHPALREAGFRVTAGALPTYPSWAPRRSLDHILVSRGLSLDDVRTLPKGASDHLAVSALVGFEEASAR